MKIILVLLTTVIGGLALNTFLPTSPTSKITRPILCATNLESGEIIRLQDTTRQMAPLLKGLGNYAMLVTTSSDEARKFFN